MAFVSRAERKLHTVSSTSVGPGAYISHAHYESSPSFAPFASTSERNFTKLFCQTSTPGIGSYTPLDLKSTNNSLDHWGHPKFSAAFASQADRFNIKNKSFSPGPGAYSVTDNWKNKKKVNKPQGGINWARIPSAPSIPANNQVFGYNETKTGELVMQKNPETVHSGTFKDSVGPGHYNVIEKTKPKGPSWNKAKGKREIFTNPSTGPEIGPGSYCDTKVSIAPMYKFTQNAVFVSKTKENDLSFDENSPGPGSYSIEKFSAFHKTKKLPRDLQNFGSSSIRFKKK